MMFYSIVSYAELGQLGLMWWNFNMKNHTPGAGSLPRPVDLQSGDVPWPPLVLCCIIFPPFSNLCQSVKTFHLLVYFQYIKMTFMLWRFMLLVKVKNWWFKLTANQGQWSRLFRYIVKYHAKMLLSFIWPRWMFGMIHLYNVSDL